MDEPIPIDSSFLAQVADIPDVVGDESSTLQQPTVEPPLPSAMLTVETLETTFGFMSSMAASMSGEGGEFWRLKELEKRELAKAWHPIIGPMLDRLGASQYMVLVTACGMTTMVLMPRVMQQRELSKHKASRKRDAQPRRTSSSQASTTDDTEMESATDSPSSLDPLAAAKAMKPIV